MRKQVFGRQLQRDSNERKALFKSLMTSLVQKESIKTTEAKAKAVKGEIEKLVTKAKKNGLQAERALQAYFSTPVARKLINEVAPRFLTRPGGYTRIIKTGNRLRDNAKMVILEWVDKKPEVIQGEVLQTEPVVPAQELMDATMTVPEKKAKKISSKKQAKSKEETGKEKKTAAKAKKK